MVPAWLCLCVCVTASSAIADPTPTTATSGKSQLWNATWTDRLKQDLLARYDKFARPAQHTKVTEVEFTLILKHVEVDESRSVMVINTWTNLRWWDEKLKWNASDYGGMDKLTVGDHEIWQPDIVLYNSAVTSMDHYANTHCLVKPNGKVLWVPPSQFSAYCNISLRKWPFDTQTCSFHFGSWLYDGEQISLKRPADYQAVLEMEPCDWTVLSVQEEDHLKYYSCCVEPYYSIEVTVTVQRQYSSYMSIIYTPAFVCAVLTLAVFWLPAASSEKFLLSGTACVISCMFLIYFSYRFPGTGLHTPLIVEFHGYTLVLVCLSMVTSVVTVNLSRRPLPRSPPRLLSRLLHSRPAVMLLVLPQSELQIYLREDSEELHERCLVDRERTESVENCSSQTASYRNWSNDWTLVAVAIDRIMFLLYLLVFFCIVTAFYFS